jgi:hypothetical protein
MALFLHFLLRDFFTFLIMSLESFAVKMSTISLPPPGQADSKLMSKSESYFAKRVSESGANAPTSPISPLKDTTNNGDDGFTGTAETPNGPNSFSITTDGSVHSSSKSGTTLVMSATAEVPLETIFGEAGSPQISCNSGMICITEVITH